MEFKENIIKNYFHGWIEKNEKVLESTFSNDIVYSECFGPEYHGLNQIKLWFSEWNNHGRVLVWDIKQFIHSNNVVAVEWYFKCEYDSEISDFDGVSIIEFNEDFRIKSLKEFKSKAQHVYPYGYSF